MRYLEQSRAGYSRAGPFCIEFVMYLYARSSATRWFSFHVGCTHLKIKIGIKFHNKAPSSHPRMKKRTQLGHQKGPRKMEYLSHPSITSIYFTPRRKQFPAQTTQTPFFDPLQSKT